MIFDSIFHSRRSQCRVMLQKLVVLLCTVLFTVSKVSFNDSVLLFLMTAVFTAYFKLYCSAVLCLNV